MLLREAGGIVTNVDGTPYDPFTPDALASNGPLHQALLDVFKKACRQTVGLRWRSPERSEDELAVLSAFVLAVLWAYAATLCCMHLVRLPC